MSFFFTNLNLGYFFDIFQGLPMTKSHQRKIENVQKLRILTVKSVDFNNKIINKNFLADYYSKTKINKDKYILKKNDYVLTSKGKRRGLLIDSSNINEDPLLYSQHFIVLRLKPGLEDKAAFFSYLINLFIKDIPYTYSKSQVAKYTKVKDVIDFQINVGFDLEAEYKNFEKEWVIYKSAKKQFMQKEIEFENYLRRLKNKFNS